MSGKFQFVKENRCDKPVADGKTGSCQWKIRPTPCCDRGIQHAEAGDVGQALESLAEALVLIPGNPVVHYNRGLVFQKAGRREEALNDYRVATGEDPNFTEAWINQAYTLVYLGRFDEALGAADRAIQLQVNTPSAWLAKGTR